jgi:8-oxo-dGTP diphosphatase
VSIDVAILAPRAGQLGVLCRRTASAQAGAVLPWGMVEPRESLQAAARRIAREAAGMDPGWLVQVGAFGDGTAHPARALLSVCFAGVVPPAADDAWPASNWIDVRSTGRLDERQRTMVEAGVEAVRLHMDHAPVAFRLLPPVFTLTELQTVYEMLLGRRLHKASFRRSLLAAWLVEPTGGWRGEGRGRPAQLFRYAPRRRRGRRRAVRFDQL